LIGEASVHTTAFLHAVGHRCLAINVYLPFFKDEVVDFIYDQLKCLFADPDGVNSRALADFGCFIDVDPYNRELRFCVAYNTADDFTRVDAHANARLPPISQLDTLHEAHCLACELNDPY